MMTKETEFQKVLIVDGNNLVYSSYHVAKNIKWIEENATSFVILRVLISIFRKRSYQNVVFVFDGGGENFRKKILESYKKQRKAIPEDLYFALEKTKELLVKSGIFYLQITNHEADDLIASIVKHRVFTQGNIYFEIFTRDKDLMQLINQRTSVLKYSEQKLISYQLSDFLKDYQFDPAFYVDYLSLLGDVSDNIAGVRGIGPVTAKILIKDFFSIENLLDKLDFLEEKYRNLLIGQELLLTKNKSLISLNSEIKIPDFLKEKSLFNWENWKENEFLRKFCLENKFFSILISLKH